MIEYLTENPPLMWAAIVAAGLLAIWFIARVAAAFSKSKEDDASLDGMLTTILNPILRLFGKGGAGVVLALLLAGYAPLGCRMVLGTSTTAPTESSQPAPGVTDEDAPPATTSAEVWTECKGLCIDLGNTPGGGILSPDGADTLSKFLQTLPLIGKLFL